MGLVREAELMSESTLVVAWRNVANCPGAPGQQAPDHKVASWQLVSRYVFAVEHWLYS